MNAEERKKLAFEIEAVAQYYGRKIERPVLSMMIDDLEDLDFGEVAIAYKTYRRNPKNRTFPLPAQIREIVAPEITPEAEGREIAASIQQAVVDHGYPNGDRARAQIGPAGWQVVQKFGGWAHLCQNLGVTVDVTTFYAQARQLAEDTVRYPQRNHLALAEPPRTNFFREEIDTTKDPDLSLNEKRDMQVRKFEDFLKQQETKDKVLEFKQ